MTDFRNIGLVVTGNTETTATAQIALLVNFGPAEGGGVEASLACAPGVSARGADLRGAVEALLEQTLPAELVERKPDVAVGTKARLVESTGGMSDSLICTCGQKQNVFKAVVARGGTVECSSCHRIIETDTLEVREKREGEAAAARGW